MAGVTVVKTTAGILGMALFLFAVGYSTTGAYDSGRPEAAASRGGLRSRDADDSPAARRLWTADDPWIKVAASCASDYSKYGMMVELQKDVWIYWTATTESVDIMVKHRTDSPVWVGVGFGSACMVGSHDVTGFPELNADMRVAEYDVVSRSKEVVSKAQHVTNQAMTFTEGNGMIMEFTVPRKMSGYRGAALDLDGRLVMNYAVGLTPWQGSNHGPTNRGSFMLDFDTCAFEWVQPSGCHEADQEYYK